ncbi:hypothetical protein ACI1UB_11240, partial [Lactococcus petauri]|uniref:hypothetical protein n=1 Tax=Lactococcus petauri TaxID=1940789 RepID=UPI0038518B91
PNSKNSPNFFQRYRSAKSQAIFFEFAEANSLVFQKQSNEYQNNPEQYFIIQNKFQRKNIFKF